jgi:hypothetical protein
MVWLDFQTLASKRSCPLSFELGKEVVRRLLEEVADDWEEGIESSEEQRLFEGVECTEDAGVGVWSGMML